MAVLFCIHFNARVHDRYRRKDIMLRSLPDISNASEIELKARFLLEAVSENRRLRNLGHGSASTSISSKSASSRVSSSHRNSAPVSKPEKGDEKDATKPILSEEDGGHDTTSVVSRELSEYSQSETGSRESEEIVNAVETGAVASRRENTRLMLSRMEQLAQKQRLIAESKALEEADDVFAHGSQRFHSSWMHLLRAQHCFYYSDNKSVALNHLSRAESRSPQLGFLPVVFLGACART